MSTSTLTTTSAPAGAAARGGAEHGVLVPRRRSPRRLVRRAGLYLALYLLSLTVVLPLLWVLATSFKSDGDAIDHPASLLPQPFTSAAYGTLFSSGSAPIFQWFLNSLAAGLLQTLLILVTASMGAYALARLDFAGKRIVFGMIVTTLFVPPIVFLIPNYLIVQGLGWLDSIWAITIPGAAGAFGIFFLRQFFLGLPVELEEAARLDGAGDVRIFLQLILPLSRPAIATLGVLSFLANWNDFLWPVYVLLSPQNLTLQPGLSALRGSYSTHFGVVMAGAVVASVPVLVLFVLAQRHVVESVASAGLKG